jgi:hypothetical protein
MKEEYHRNPPREPVYLPAPQPRIENPVQRGEMARRMGELARSLTAWTGSEASSAPARPRPHYVEDRVPEPTVPQTEPANLPKEDITDEINI